MLSPRDVGWERQLLQDDKMYRIFMMILKIM